MQYSLLFHCNNGCINAPQRYVIRTLPVLLLYEFISTSSEIFCVTYDLQLISVFANGVPVVWLWWMSSCCAIIIRYKHSSYFISIVKLYVPILHTNHHQTSYKTVRKKCILSHITMRAHNSHFLYILRRFLNIITVANVLCLLFVC